MCRVGLKTPLTRAILIYYLTIFALLPGVYYVYD